MKYLVILFSMFLGTVALAQGSNTGSRIDIARGTGLIIDLPAPVHHAFVANPGVADIEAVGETAIYAYGVGTGVTTLITTDAEGRLIAEYELRVFRDTAQDRQNLSRLGLGNSVGITYLGDRATISGSINSPEEARRLDALKGQLSGDDTVADLTEYKGDTQIRLDLRIAEVQTAGLRRLGIRLGGIRSSGLLNALASQGIAQILAEPSLVTTNGQAAELFSGGEFPVASGEDNSQTSGRRYGVTLAFTPTLLSNDKVSVDLFAEISAPVAAQATDTAGVPGRTVRSLTNTAEIEDGQTYAMGGLFQQTSDFNASRIPGLSEIPVFGPFFRAERHEATESELLILVTPTILGSDDSETARVAPSKPVNDLVGFTVRPELLK
ncbi:Type II/IV secretion system secretin RcpA/CpaC [Candidatus Rhodobacter oscarellae]|uniref:Type II/IV secretion system secretin RcpA/CpaC n=1 Tax=Candidatus Rhodobacter oscarellae TaxID=1675527 RepID=A0A0J9E116_9RHOB|nr:pilus assembly protein N-terminal domain-containing protein [Candidatus Rhodobacter lobularis]KMW56372.1 Type II/IV secretion system secretin RcpA/CpaC [Candidatus Rhodobacter lobularis]